MSILILSNLRSLNKGVGHLEALNCLLEKVYILVNDVPSDYENNLLKKYSFDLIVDDFSNLESIKFNLKNKKIKAVVTLSENLLILQNKIESMLDLDQSMTLEGAFVLSNKFFFDKFCHENNITVPKFSLIKNKLDFKKINYPCITKSTIGSGQYYTIRNNDIYFEYKKFKDGIDLQKYLEEYNLIDTFLSVNNSGLFLNRYGKTPLHFYTQEFIDEEKTFATSGAIINGVPYFYLTGELIKYFEYNKILSINDIDRLGKENGYSEHIMYIMNKPNIDLVEKYKKFYDILIKKFQIKNMFFSGPDIYCSNSKEFFIDLNCRISGQYNLVYKRTSPNSFVNSWKSILYNEDMTDYQMKESAATGYPLLMPGRYFKKGNLYDDNVDFLNFKEELSVPEARRNMYNKDLQEKIVVYGETDLQVKQRYNNITTTILNSYI